MRTRDEALHKRRKSEILSAAALCFAAKGVHQTSMQEICEAAAISAGALYRYFESKDAIIFALAEQERLENAELIAHLTASEDLVEGLCQALPEIVALSGDEQYGRLTIEIGAEAARNPAIAEVFARNETELRGALVDALKRGQGRGDVDPSLDPEAATFLILALFDGMPGRRLFVDDVAPDRLVGTLAGFLRKILGSA